MVTLTNTKLSHVDNLTGPSKKKELRSSWERYN